jgi:hypothetical protein
MTKFLVLLFLLVSLSFGATHGDLKGSNTHTPIRWVVADSAARVALSVAAKDTMKCALQLSDTTLWILLDSASAEWGNLSATKSTLDLDTIVGPVSIDTIEGPVAIDTIDGGVVATGSAQAASFTTNGSYSVQYDSVSFYDSLFDGATYRARVLATIIRIGDEVTLYQPYMVGTLSGPSTDTYIHGIPDSLAPDTSVGKSVTITSNGAAELGIAVVKGDGTIFLARDGLNYFVAGTGGIGGFFLGLGNWHTVIRWKRRL